ncbi:Ig-like domain-containing protein [Pseudomonas sp. PDM20]|uniref:Ig-like domain-containing protein n=1 Tax=Pseudomonas sp. PDM20 TaxID=2769254 RepID=UPI00177C7C51|nr:Ig-like domain-containing protein [Pseudomonas sp. PDM20]MBD9682611.1 Ig-like domain-containing protein [Pseudomonas sp. PDM20]
MAIETIGLIAVTENAAKKLAVKTGGKIKAHAGTKYLLQVENSDVAPENVTVKRVGKDLLVQFEGSEKPDLTIQDFFAEGMDSQLYGVAEDGQLYAYVRTDGQTFGDSQLLLADGDSAPIALGGDSLGNGAAYLASTFDDAAGFVLWPWLLGLAGVGAATAAIIHHNKDNGGHHDKSTSSAPTNTKVIDDVGPIQGELHNGDITDDKHPEISGNGVPGAIIHIFDNGQEIGSTTVAQDGTWSYTPELADGGHSIEVTQEVPGQKPSAPVEVIDIVVDTTPPAAPTAEIDGAKVDGGETYSNDDKPSIHGDGTPGDTIIVVYPTGETVNTVVDDDGHWVAPKPTQPLPEGDNEIKVIEQDPAGNQTEITVPVIIDTVAPVAPEGHLDPESDSGIKGDSITNDTKPTIEGKTEPGADITVKIPSTGEEIHAKADDQGNWQITPTQDLPEGKNDIIIIAIDPAGNPSDPTTITVVIDTQGPEQPDAWLDPESDSGIKDDNITNDTKPTIDGKTEPGADVTVSFPTGETITTQADAEGNWQVTPTQELADGDQKIVIIATDPAGNPSEPKEIIVTIDTQEPGVPTIGSVVNNEDPSHLVDIPRGGMTNDTTPVISGGGAEKGDIIHVFDGKTELGSTVAGDDGKWSFEVPADKALDEGEHLITVQAEDPAGNPGKSSDPYPIKVDLDGPTPKNTYLTIDVVAGDDIVNTEEAKHEQTISGKAIGKFMAGDLVKFDLNDTHYSAAVDKDGNWSVKVAGADLVAGVGVDRQINATLYAHDAAGNTGEIEQEHPYKIDLDAPSKPTIEQVLDHTGAITGPITNGGETDEKTPTLSGKAEADSIVTIKDDKDGVLGSTTAKADGTWEFTPAKDLSEGEHSFTVEATDKAGNVSVPSEPFVITTDYTPPDVSKLAITGVLDSVGEVTGNILSGGTTDDARPVISGTGTAGDTIVVHGKDVNGQDHILGSATVGTDGTWTLKPVLPLISGLNELTAVESDAAGNASTSKVYEVILDQGKPEVPVIVSVYDDVGPYTGFLQKGDVTDDKQPTFNGTAQAGSIVKLYDTDQTLIGSGIADSDGNWTITTSELANGKHEVIATATNGVGVVSEPTGIWDFIVDTTPPSNVSNLVITDDVGDQQGPLHDKDITDDNRPTFSGDAEPNGKVIIYDNGAKIGEADVDADGKWEFTPSTALDDGEHNFATEVLDPAGNSSGKADQIGVTVDTKDVEVQITHVIDKTGSIQGDIALHGVTDEQRPEIQGTSKPGSVIKITDNGVELGSVTANNDGYWSFKPSSDLAETLHKIEATATDLAGNVSAPAKYDFTVDLTAPSKPTIEQVYDDVGAVQGPVANGGVTDDSTPTLSGKAEAGSIVIIKDGATDVLGSVIAKPDGTWSYTPTTPISEGEHTFSVTATDAAGNTSVKSDDFVITTDYHGPNDDSTKLIIDIVAGDDVVNKKESEGNVSISGKATGEFSTGDLVKFTLNGTTYSAAVDKDGLWKVDVAGSDLIAGEGVDRQIDATLSAHDAAGNPGDIKAKHAYSIDLDAPSKPTIEQVLDDYGTITGPITNGGVTDDSTPTLSGKAEADSIVTIKDDKDGVLGSTIAKPDGTWEFTPAKDLSEGEHSFTVIATDPAGNPSVPSDKFVITTDYTPPTATLTIVSVAGDDVVDSTEAAGTVSITGTSTGAREGDVVTLTINGKAYSTTVESDGKWTVNGVAGSDLVADSDHKVDGTLHATDVAGNYTDAIATPHAYEVKLAPTAIAQIVSMDKESGVSLSDWLTNNGDAGRLISGTISGTLATGEKVQVSTDGGSTWSDALVSGSKWDVMDPNAHSGNWTIQTRVVAADGTAGEVKSQAVTLDTVAPSHATNITYADGVVSVSFNGADKAVGDLLDVVVAGKHFSYALTAADISAGKADVSGTGAESRYDVKVALVDRAGNVSDYLSVTSVDRSFTETFSGLNTNIYRNNPVTTDNLIVTNKSALVDGWTAIKPWSYWGLTSETMLGVRGGVVSCSLKDGASATSFTGTFYDIEQVDFTQNPGGPVLLHGQALRFYDANDKLIYTVDLNALGTTRAMSGTADAINGTFSWTMPAGTSFVRFELDGGEDWFTVDNVKINATVNNGVDTLVWTDADAVQNVLAGASDYYGDSGSNTFAVADVAVLSSTGVHGGPGGIDTLKLTGAGQTLSLSTLINAGKLDNVEVLDITGSGNNTLKVSLNDVLHLGQVDLFRKDGKVQLKVDGDAGDKVELYSLEGHGVDSGTWQSAGTTTIGGVTYQVFTYSLMDAEILIKQGVTGAIMVGNDGGSAVIESMGVSTDFVTVDGSANGVSDDHAGALGTSASTDTSQSLPFALPTMTHAVAGMADTYYGAGDGSVVTLQYAADQYLASGENQGIHGGDGVDVLKLAGHDQSLDLTLATSQGKLSGMEVIDLGGAGHNTLTLSLKDVLENGQADLFHSTDKHSVQMLVQGDASDTVNLAQLQGKDGVAGGSWTDKGAVMVGGTSYEVYQHSSLDAELLVQQAVKVNLV